MFWVCQNEKFMPLKGPHSKLLTGPFSLNPPLKAEVSDRTDIYCIQNVVLYEGICCKSKLGVFLSPPHFKRFSFMATQKPKVMKGVKSASVKSKGYFFKLFYIWVKKMPLHIFSLVYTYIYHFLVKTHILLIFQK